MALLKNWYIPVSLSAGEVRWKAGTDDGDPVDCSIVDKGGPVELTIGDQSTLIGGALLDALFFLFARRSSAWDAAAQTLVEEVLKHDAEPPIEDTQPPSRC